MKIPFVISIMFCCLAVSADPSVGVMSVTPNPSINWSNAQPAQKQALDNFYQSLQNMQQVDQADRLQALEQLRGMTSEQRQQMLRNMLIQQQQLQQQVP